MLFVKEEGKNRVHHGMIEEIFYIDRGDRVDVSHCIKKKDGPVVVLGTKQGRVHILRHGGRIKVADSSTTAAVEEENNVEEGKNIKINLSLVGLNSTYHSTTARSIKNAAVTENDDGVNQITISGSSKYSIEKNCFNDEKDQENEKESVIVDVIINDNYGKVKVYISEKIRKQKLDCKYWYIGTLRKYGMTIWPYA